MNRTNTTSTVSVILDMFMMNSKEKTIYMAIRAINPAFLGVLFPKNTK